MTFPVMDYKFRVKDVDESGTFEGFAAVYGNVDLGNDVIAPGAFTRTIKNSEGRVPILWQHDKREPIGAGRLSDSREGLILRGKLVLESDVARKAHGLMKAEVLNGLSIGYDLIKSEYDKKNDARLLKEIKVWEVSLVTFPMNPRALVSSVKSQVEGIASSVKSLYDGLKNGHPLSQEMRDDLIRISGKLQALIATDTGNDSDASPAKNELSDSDLHSLMNTIKEIL
jgi:HK97 family phage prohead protease